MSERLSIEQKIQQYRQANPKLNGLSDKQILSVMVENGEVTLSEAQKVSIYSNSQSNVDNQGLTVQKQTKSRTINLKSGRKIVIKDGTAKYYAGDGVELKREYFEKQEGKIDVRPSGRYSVTKAGKTKYYAADGTELKESYFKRVENTDVKIKGTDGKTYNLNKTLENRINKVTVDLEKSEDNNGFIGSAWSGFKNLTGIGDSSDKVREQQETEKKLLQQFNSNEQKRSEIFKELTGAEYTPENLEKFIKGEIKLKSEIALQGYNEGQEMAVDITADIVSGIAAVGIYTAAVAAAPFTGGASISVGVVAAGSSGAVIKTGLKAADAAIGGREYTLQDAKHDAATGAFSGIIAPVTGGLGGAVGKTVATKLGVQAVKQVGKEVAQEAAKGGVKQTIKTMFTNPTGYEYVGGNAVKRGLAFATETATDGAVGGAVDNAFRTAYDGGGVNEVLDAAAEGFVGGAIMSPIIGGGIKSIGKGAQKAFGKDNVDIDANGNKVHVNEDETVTKINDNASGVLTDSPDTEIHIPKGTLASDIYSRLAAATSREDFIAIRDEIKVMPNSKQKSDLQLEYIKKYNEFSREYNNEFDIKMEYSPKSNDYLQRLSKVHFSKNGDLDTREVKLYENFKRAMHKVLIATVGRGELPENIIFREIPEHSGGIACTTGENISINRCFLDNIDSNIKNIVQDLKGIGMLNVDIDGKIRIPDLLKNDITLELEKKLNAYSDKMNLADKLELYTCYIGYFVDLQSQIRRHPIVTIEKIMKTGSNQTVLKKQGLFRTRQEVNAMNKGEQIAYLKEIASITGIPENAVLIRDIDQLYIHELGHLNHKLSKEDEMFLRSKKVIEEHQNNPEIQNTCSKVSRYAQQLPMEFVAEVFSGLVSGQKFDADVMSLYAKYKGPQLFN